MPQDWYQQFAPSKPVTPTAPTAKPADANPTDDWFRQFTPSKAAPERSWWDSAGDFLKESLSSITPSKINKGVQALNPLTYNPETGDWTPYDTFLKVGEAQGHLAEKAKAAYDAGDYTTAARHALNYMIPVLGGRLDEAGDMMQRGEYAKGLGATVDVAAQVALPAALKQAKNLRVPAGGRVETPAPFPNPNPAEAEAVAYGLRNEIPIDAGTATGSNVVKRAQQIAGDTLGGARVAEATKARQADRLATVGEQLAARANQRGGGNFTIVGEPMTPETAGASLRDATLGEVRKHAKVADDAYAELRAMEADPANTREFTFARAPENAAPAAPGRGSEALGGRFAPKGAPQQALFDAIYEDAQRQGWRGNKKQLREVYDERLKSAKALGDDMDATAGQYSPEALLRTIRQAGGLRPWVKEAGVKATGDFDRIRDVFATGEWKQKGGASIFRGDGVPIDQLVDEVLKHDPRFADMTPQSLLAELDDIASLGPSNVASTTRDLESLLEATGVRRGAKWWEGGDDVNAMSDADRITSALDGSYKTRTESVPMGVDLRPSKEALRPVLEHLKKKKELTGQLYGDEGRAAVALDALVNGPDAAPLSVVDGALSDIKALARSDVPELRSVGQGKAAQAVKALHAQVDDAAAAAGPKAVEALARGREATKAKIFAGDVYESLNAEPVKAFKQATLRKDAGIEQLRKLDALVPEELPKIGRAYLDELMTRATAEGGFQKAQGLKAEWDNLGTATKQLLFRDPAYVKDLDNFFLLAKKIAENPNPSGSARNLTLLNAGLSAGTFPLAKLLYSPAGVRALTRGLAFEFGRPNGVINVPLGSKAAATAASAEISRLVGELTSERLPAAAGQEKEAARGPQRR